MPEWTRVDLGARYETVMFDRDKIFRATVENVAEKSYWSSPAGSTLTLGARGVLALATAKF